MLVDFLADAGRQQANESDELLLVVLVRPSASDVVQDLFLQLRRELYVLHRCVGHVLTFLHLHELLVKVLHQNRHVSKHDACDYGPH